MKKDPTRFTGAELLQASPSLVLLYGNEEGLMGFLEEEIREDLRERQASWRRVEEGAFLHDPQNFLLPDLFSLETGMPRVFFIEDPSDKNASLYKKLLPELSRTTLVLTSAKLRTTSALVQLALKEDRAWGVGCYALEIPQKLSLIQRVAKRKGLGLVGDVGKTMATFCNPGDLHQLLSQCSLLSQGPLTQEIFEACWGETREEGGELSYALSGRDSGKVALWIDAVGSSQDLLMGVRQAQRHFLQMLEIRTALDHKRDLETAIRHLKPPVFFKNLPAFRVHVSQWQAVPLASAVGLLVQSEIEAKKGIFSHLPTHLLRQILCL